MTDDDKRYHRHSRRHDEGDEARERERARQLSVRARRHGSHEILEVHDGLGALVATYDVTDVRLRVEVSERAVDVAALLAPLLMDGEQPLGEISPRFVDAADRLWQALQTAPYTWQRSVPMRDRLLFFYCPLARLAVELVDGGEVGDAVADPGLRRHGIQLATVAIGDLDSDQGGVLDRLSRLCAKRADDAVRAPSSSGPVSQSTAWRQMRERFRG